MKIRVIIKKLSNPRVRKRLKIGLTIYAAIILTGVLFKVVYDIGYFNAQSHNDEAKAGQTVTPSVLTMESAQRIVSGALNENPSNPKTMVDTIINNNQNLASIIIIKDNQKTIAWIIDKRLFFTGDLLNDKGYNLTEGYEHQYNIIRGAR